MWLLQLADTMAAAEMGLQKRVKTHKTLPKPLSEMLRFEQSQSVKGGRGVAG